MCRKILIGKEAKQFVPYVCIEERPENLRIPRCIIRYTRWHNTHVLSSTSDQFEISIFGKEKVKIEDISETRKKLVKKSNSLSQILGYTSLPRDQKFEQRTGTKNRGQNR